MLILLRLLSWYDESLTLDEQNDYKSLNTYMWFYPIAQPGTITINAPGYMESELSDNIGLKVCKHLWGFITSLQIHYN